MGSGLQYFNPFTDRIHIVDMKTNIINLTRQKALTRDNIEVDIDAAVYYNIKIPRRTFYCVADIHKSVQELTFATLRSVCGHYVLQELLEKRDEVTLELGKFVARQVHEWGIEITNILIKDIVLNQELQDILAAVAKEKRLAESKILNATAEVESAKLMRQTADILSGKAAMQIRYLEAVQNMASNQNVKVVFLAEEN
jgi:regulator of protease activity HflC (stomatin/prohibitin superfamily)